MNAAAQAVLLYLPYLERLATRTNPTEPELVRLYVCRLGVDGCACDESWALQWRVGVWDQGWS